jgi:hypothetical protein
MLQKRNAATSITKSRLRESNMLTRKDYIKIAKLFKDTLTSPETIEGFIVIAKEDNPRFDAVKFRAAAMDWT